MKKMMLASMLGTPKTRSCPDCGSPMEMDGTCSECGYGESNGEEMDGESEHNDRMIEVRDDLQRIVDKLSKLIS